MALKVQSFNNGAGDGTNVTALNSDDGAGNSALSLVLTNSGSIVYDDDHTALTALPWSALFTQSATNTIMLGMADTGALNNGISIYIYITGSPSSSGNFGIRSQTSAAAQGAKLYLSSTRFLQIVGGFGTISAVGAAVPLNTWVRLEFWWTGNGTNATFNAAWYTGHSGTPGDSLTTGPQAYTLDCAEFRVGLPQGAVTMAPFWVTGWQQNIGSGSQIGSWPTNVTPTAAAGSDQSNIEPYSTVTLDGSSSFDPDGTIASYNWSVVSTTNGAAVPTLSGSGATRTFKAPGALLGTDVTCRLTVTDNLGSTSPQDDVIISVLPVTERWVTGGVEVPVEVQVIP